LLRLLFPKKLHKRAQEQCEHTIHSRIKQIFKSSL
jgi:hypothetical protein